MNRERRAGEKLFEREELQLEGVETPFLMGEAHTGFVGSLFVEENREIRGEHCSRRMQQLRRE